MSFPQQTKYISPLLVEQGWRREPEQKVKDAWTASNGWHQWEMIVVRGPDNTRIPIYRPVTLIGSPFPAFDGECGIYSHAGWGEGMTPTDDTVKVWPSWWKDMDGILMPITVATNSGKMFPTFQKNLGEFWRGPVLPPARTA